LVTNGTNLETNILLAKPCN